MLAHLSDRHPIIRPNSRPIDDEVKEQTFNRSEPFAITVRPLVVMMWLRESRLQYELGHDYQGTKGPPVVVGGSALPLSAIPLLTA
ncbi:ATP-dependent DNA helicase chl1 [Fusarium oxysporum f. sp. albedinis]|nr:ATP-dependent DNA helicase chl1 [Fusarium oxysporum f. sp. albedinis]